MFHFSRFQTTRASSLPAAIAAVSFVAAAPALLARPAAPVSMLPAILSSGGVCEVAALSSERACIADAIEGYWWTRSNCLNLPMAQRAQCMIDGLFEFGDRIEECRDQRDARLDLCQLLGGGIYHPIIDPNNFVSSIDNPYLPLTPGTTFVYEKNTADGLERIHFTVTHETKEILGVTCVVVHDIVTVDDEVEEDTFDWFAQDVLGNVWYFGELSFEYEDGEIAGIDGSWKAGEDFAKPGIVMLAAPQPGTTYRQEFLIDEAEDAATVVSLDAAVSVPFGAFPNCLKTEEFTPLEPDVLEFKFYAPGVGLLLEVDGHSGARTELVDIVIE